MARQKIMFFYKLEREIGTGGSPDLKTYVALIQLLIPTRKIAPKPDKA